MIKIERLRFRYIWSMMTRRIHECWHVRTNKCVRTNICKKSVFVVSVRNINICGRILIQFTGLLLLLTNTVAAKRNLLAERTGLGKSVSVSLRNAGRRTDFWDKKSSDFSGEIFPGEEFLPRTAFSGKKCRSILSNQVISWYESRTVGCPLGREFTAKTCSLLGNEGTPPDAGRRINFFDTLP